MMEKLGTDEVTDAKGNKVRAEVVQLDLHDGRLRRARFRGADPPARRHARPDGQARRLDHRDADHRELPRGPERAAVLHLDPRRPQGPGRHGVEDRELRLPDPPSGRRGAGPGGHRGSTAARPTASSMHADRRRRRRRRGPGRARARPRRRRGRRRRLGTRRSAGRRPARCSTRSWSSCSRRWASTRSRSARRSPARRATASARSATAAIWAAAIASTSARRSASSPRSRSASRARSSRCAPSTSAARPRGRRRPTASRSSRKGTIRLHNIKTVRHEKGHLVAVSRSGELGVVDEFGRERERYKIPYGATITVNDGDVVVGRASRSPTGIRTPTRSSPKWPA